MNSLLKEGKVDEAEAAAASILAMYISEYQKGIYDHDHGVMQNTGFIGSQPFHLDVGKFNKDERMKDVAVYKKDLTHVIWKMDYWVKTNYPGYYDRFSNFLSRQYEQWTGETIDLPLVDPKLLRKKRH